MSKKPIDFSPHFKKGNRFCLFFFPLPVFAFRLRLGPIRHLSFLSQSTFLVTQGIKS